MRVRSRALWRIVAALPECTKESPPYLIRMADEFRNMEEAWSVPIHDKTSSQQRLIFNKTPFAYGSERWFEWTLEISGDLP